MLVNDQKEASVRPPHCTANHCSEWARACRSSRTVLALFCSSRLLAILLLFVVPHSARTLATFENGNATFMVEMRRTTNNNIQNRERVSIIRLCHSTRRSPLVFLERNNQHVGVSASGRICCWDLPRFFELIFPAVRNPLCCPPRYRDRSPLHPFSNSSSPLWVPDNWSSVLLPY